MLSKNGWRGLALASAVLLFQVACSTLPDSKRGFDREEALRQMNRTLTAQRQQAARLDSEEWEEYLGPMDSSHSMTPNRRNWMMRSRSQANWSGSLLRSSNYDRDRADAKLLYFNPVSALDLPSNQ